MAIVHENSKHVLRSKLAPIKHQILGACIILIMVGLSVFVWKWAVIQFSVKTIPMLTSDTDYLFLVENNTNLDFQPQLLSMVLSQLISLDLDEANNMLDEMRAYNPEEYGIVLRNSKKYWFVKNPQNYVIDENSQELMISNAEPLSINIVISEYVFGSDKYLFFGDDTWHLDFNGDTFHYLSLKKRFAELAHDSGSTMIWPSINDIETSLFGHIVKDDNLLKIQISKNVESFGQEISEKEIIKTNVAMQAMDWSDHIAGMFNGFLGLNDGINQYALTSNIFPGELIIDNTDLTKFYQNPFSPDIYWIIKKNISEEQARDYLKQILNDISKAFPAVESHKLPDSSLVYEIKYGSDSFIDIDLTSDSIESGLITYPNDQILYEFNDNVLIIEKGKIENMEVVHNSCVLPGAIVQGRMESTIDEILVWKSVNFSYNSDTFLVCVDSY